MSLARIIDGLTLVVIVGGIAGAGYILIGSKQPPARNAPVGISQADSATANREGHVIGSVDARHVVVEFADFECPFCQAMIPVLDSVRRARPDVAVRFRHLPLTAIHPYSMKAAVAAECAADQGSFAAFHNVLFDQHGKFAQSDWAALAGTVHEIDIAAFRHCLADTGRAVMAVSRDTIDAAALHIQATPAFFVGRTRITGAVSTARILELLSKDDQHESGFRHLLRLAGLIHRVMPIPAAEPVKGDSAGISIVTFALGQPSTRVGVTLALAPEPEARVGASPRDSLDRLIHVVSASYVNSRVVVGLRNAGTLRLFDRSGHFVRTFGHRDGDSSDVKSISGSWWLADGGFGVYDAHARRLSVFDTLGERLTTKSFGRVVDDEKGAVLAGVVGFVGPRSAIGIAQIPLPVSPGFSRPQIELALLDSFGAHPAAGPFLGQERHISPPNGMGSALGIAPFAPNTLLAAGYGEIALADNERYNISVMNPRGEIRLVIRADVRNENADRQAFHDEIVGMAEGRDVPIRDKDLDQMRSERGTDQMPVLRSVFLDGQNNLWVEEFARPRSAVRRVLIFASDGAMRGGFELPSAYDLLNATGNSVVLRSRGRHGDVVSVFRLVSLSPSTVAALN